MGKDTPEVSPQTPPDLGAWYAEPLAVPAARRLLKRARDRQQQAFTAGTDGAAWAVQEMIARFWLGRPIESQYRNLLKTTRDEGVRVLAELVYGQLLMSRRLRGADRHLRAAFARAAALLAPADYFAVMKRHELLGHLALRAAPSPPLGLDALLREAAVIRTLKRAHGRFGRSGGGRRDDTLG
ncbi:MAG: hypothetical protein P8076_03890 [Gammaproteobacteria bacterium]